MSLDVYLTTKNPIIKSGTGVFVRENGTTIELTSEQVKEKFPNAENISETESETNTVYSANITHNLNTMADAADLYKVLWRPDEINITKAQQLIEPLTKGLQELRSNPEKYEAFNPDNGWGDYNQLVNFVKNYLKACIDNPDADVNVWR